MHGSERRVALGHGSHQHPDRPQVEELLDAGLLDAERLAPHLAPYAVDVLGAAGHLRVDGLASQLRLDVPHHILDVAFAVDAPFVQLPGDGLVGRRLRFPEREVLDLPLVLPDPETTRERCVDVQSLACEALALRDRTRARMAQPMQREGDLHNQDTHVVDDGEKQPAQPIGPSVPVGGRGVLGLNRAQLVEALEPFEERRGPVAEMRPRVVEPDPAALEEEAGETRGDAVRVEVELREHLRRGGESQRLLGRRRVGGHRVHPPQRFARGAAGRLAPAEVDSPVRRRAGEFSRLAATDRR